MKTAEAKVEPRVTFLETKKGTFIFQMKEGGTFVVNDDILFISDATSYGIREFEIHAKPKTLVKVYTKSVIDHYVDADGSKILPETYDRKIENLVRNAHYCNRGDYDFSNLDEEYEYKKFIRSWTKVNKEVEIREEIPFAIGGVIYSEYREIVPLAQIGGELNDPICKLTLSPINVLKEICQELDIAYYNDDEKVSTDGHYIQNASHSGIQYIKFNGNYVCTDEKAYKEAHQYRDTYENCVRDLKHYKEGIRKMIKARLFVEENKSITKSERKVVVAELRNIISIYGNVLPFTKSHNAYYSAKNKLTKLLETLEEGIKP